MHSSDIPEAKGDRVPLIPQPLKGEAKVDGKVHVQIDLPPEARKLMADLHDDRVAIGLGTLFLLAMIGVATLKYVLDWRRRA